MEKPTRSDDDLVELGRITGVFGVRGEVKLFLENSESHLLRGEHLVVLMAPTGARRAVTLSARPGAGKRILGRIDGVTDRDAAAALRDHTVWLPRDQLPVLEDGEYYLWQLEGAAVEHRGAVIGRVTFIHTDGPVELFEVALDDGETTWIPSLSEFVEAVDVDAARIRLVADAFDEE